MLHSFAVFARYNRWANRRLYAALGAPDPTVLNRDGGAAFGSILGTLNHLLVADRNWLLRLTGDGHPPVPLDHRLAADLATLSDLRAAEDVRIIEVVDSLNERAVAATVAYTKSSGERFETPVADILAHIFNHQAHHRGQVHALLTRFAGAAPPLDLMFYGRETGDLISPITADG